MKTVDKILTDIIYECYHKSCDGHGTTECLACDILQQAKQEIIKWAKKWALENVGIDERGVTRVLFIENSPLNDEECRTLSRAITKANPITLKSEVKDDKYND